MPAGGHLDEACADRSFPKTSLHVDGMVIASYYCFIVFKVDALSRGSVMNQCLHLTNQNGTLALIPSQLPNWPWYVRMYDR
jgi:hypothetical protein